MENLESMLSIRLDSIVFKALLKAQDWDSLRSSAHALVKRMGVNDFLMRLDRRFCSVTSGSRLFGSLPNNMLATLDGQMQNQGHFVCRQVSHSRLPFDWTAAELSACAYDRAYNALQAYGFVQGVSVGVRGEDTYSRVDFLRSGPVHPFSAEQRADLMLLAPYLHEAGQALWRQQNSDSMSMLVTREHACA